MLTVCHEAVSDDCKTVRQHSLLVTELRAFLAQWCWASTCIDSCSTLCLGWAFAELPPGGKRIPTCHYVRVVQVKIASLSMYLYVFRSVFVSVFGFVCACDYKQLVLWLCLCLCLCPSAPVCVWVCQFCIFFTTVSAYGCNYTYSSRCASYCVCVGSYRVISFSNVSW